MNKIFIAVSLLILMIWSVIGCSALMGLERRQIVVTDQSGKPISGISVFPQPIVLGKKQSDDKGKLWVYVLDPTRRFQLSGPGYKAASFSFDQPSEMCVLQKD